MSLTLPFYIFAGMAIAFSFAVVLKKNPVASAFSLVMVFFSFAGIYASIGAHLIAALQILVYAGAIMVLFVFVIMLLQADEPSLDLFRTSKSVRSIAGISIGILFLLLSYGQWKAVPRLVAGRFDEGFVLQHGGNSKVISQLMFSEYLLPFELTSLLLLVAIVVAVAIAKRKLSQK